VPKLHVAFYHLTGLLPEDILLQVLGGILFAGLRDTFAHHGEAWEVRWVGQRLLGEEGGRSARESFNGMSLEERGCEGDKRTSGGRWPGRNTLYAASHAAQPSLSARFQMLATTWLTWICRERARNAGAYGVWMSAIFTPMLNRSSRRGSREPWRWEAHVYQLESCGNASENRVKNLHFRQ